MRKIIIMIFSILSMTGCGNNRNNGNEVLEEPQNSQWEIIELVDDFGDKIGKYRVVQTVEGYFSNSATANSPLIVRACFEKSNNSFYDRFDVDFTIQCDEYGNGTWDGSGTGRVRSTADFKQMKVSCLPIKKTYIGELSLHEYNYEIEEFDYSAPTNIINLYLQTNLDGSMEVSKETFFIT